MASKHIFTPFTGIQHIQFGNVRSFVRKQLGNPDKSFHRGASEITTDFYEKEGIFIEYNAADLCEAIEFTNYSNLFYKGENLFDLNYSELLKKHNPISLKKDIEEGKGINFLDLGFGVCRETKDSDQIESIIIFSEDYWL